MNYTLHVCYTYKKKIPVHMYVQSGSFDQYLYFSIFQSSLQDVHL